MLLWAVVTVVFSQDNSVKYYFFPINSDNIRAINQRHTFTANDAQFHFTVMTFEPS